MPSCPPEVRWACFLREGRRAKLLNEGRRAGGREGMESRSFEVADYHAYLHVNKVFRRGQRRGGRRRASFQKQGKRADKCALQ